MAAIDLEPEISDSEKHGMQLRAAAGGPFTKAERDRLLGYCASDVRDTERIWERVWEERRAPTSQADRWVHAMIRGRYAAVAGKMYLRGIPVDESAVTTLVEHKDALRAAVIRVAREEYPGLFDGESMPQRNFRELLRKLGALEAWPRTRTKLLSTSEETFKRMVPAFPALRTLAAVMHTDSHLRRVAYETENGRAHVMPGLWITATGRANPTNTRFVLSGPKWTRGVVRPEPGTVLLDCDFAGQEFLINGVLSGDLNMIRAYEAGDPHMAFAIDAGLAPKGATKASHRAMRNAAKECNHGIGYGQTAYGLRRKLRKSQGFCEDLIERHRRTYKRFHAWNTLVRKEAREQEVITTQLGWYQGVCSSVTENTLRNFKAQATGGDILRLAVIALDQAGYKVLATNHDSILLEVPIEFAAHAKQAVPRTMSEAGAELLQGHRLRVDTDLLYPGDTLLPNDATSKRFWTMFGRMQELLDPDDPIFGVGGELYRQSDFLD